jgi:hypothetical protein
MFSTKLTGASFRWVSSAYTHCYGLSVWTVRCNSAVFTKLKAGFRLESWKIAYSMKDGVAQLVTNTDQLEKLGELRHRYHLTYHSDW